MRKLIGFMLVMASSLSHATDQLAVLPSFIKPVSWENLGKPILSPHDIQTMTWENQDDLFRAVGNYRAVIAVATECMIMHPDQAQAISANLKTFIESNLLDYMTSYKALLEFTNYQSIGDSSQRTQDYLGKIGDYEISSVHQQMTNPFEHQICDGYAKGTSSMYILPSSKKAN